MTDKSKGNNSSNKTPAFSIGPKAQREVRNALAKSRNPAETISQYQRKHSLHSMMAKAFGTTPSYAADDIVIPNTTDNTSERGYSTTATTSTAAEEQPQKIKMNVESLDTDSVISFLGHLGVSQYEVHKRVGDALQKQLEDELRKVTAQEPLLSLLQNCWPYATVNAEFRPILWAVLRQLGTDTPHPVLQALAERDKKTGQLKHAEIFRPLPSLLKRLCWEADWKDRIPVELENSIDTSPKQYLKLLQSTLFFETVQPLIETYMSTPVLVESSDKFFVHSTLDRKVLTSQRRALVNTTSMAMSPTRGATSSAASSLLGKSMSSASKIVLPNGGATSTPDGTTDLSNSAEAISQIRNILGTQSYRPQLLHAIMSILMAQHGTLAATSLVGTEQGLLAGQSHLHCTLVTDIMLSTSGPLPKEYAQIHRLARVLDDAVARGVFTDKDLLTVQAVLKVIYNSEKTIEDDTDNTKDDASPEKQSKRKRVEENEDIECTASAKKSNASSRNKINKSLVRQLNQIIISGLTAMKKSDPQSLFLNPVTDAIAPGYNKVIKKPMSILTMEKKIENNLYSSIDDWELDVRLMFKNCVDYNRGEAGQWFRGEAKRQLQIFNEEILPQAKKLFTIELQKRNFEEEAVERRRRKEEEERNNPKISPLDAVTKTRKIESQEYSLSMPAVAGMLLADPFVVRILLDRVLRSIRMDTNKGAGIPAEHQVIPSIMQLLFLAQWSPTICAFRGQKIVMSESGLKLPAAMDTPEMIVPYTSLRHYLPLIVHLLRDADMDNRLALGGDLHAIAQSSLERPEPKLILNSNTMLPSQIAMAVFEGSYIYVCLPGNSQDTSLSITFVKFSNVFQQIAHGTVWDERSFYKCLVPTILRHKSRLHKKVRDVIISTWIGWLQNNPSSSSRDVKESPTKISGSKKKKRQEEGSMETPAHQYLLQLLNDWAANFGNLLMPRDLLLEKATEIVQVVNDTEVVPERKFSLRWNAEQDIAFAPIKSQYERLISLLPQSHRERFQESTGIETAIGGENKAIKQET